MKQRDLPRIGINQWETYPKFCKAPHLRLTVVSFDTALSLCGLDISGKVLLSYN